MTEELQRLLDLVSRLSERARGDLRNLPSKTTLAQGVILYWFAKVAKTFDAIRLLWQEGYWQDASSLARTILELVFQSEYLSRDPEAHAELFMSHDARQRVKLLKTLDAYNDPTDTDISSHLSTLTLTKG